MNYRVCQDYACNGECGREIIFRIPAACSFSDELGKVLEGLVWASKRKLDASTMERYHNEPLQDSRVLLPLFYEPNDSPCSTCGKLVCARSHDQSKRKARTGAAYQGTVKTYWSLDMKKPVSNAGFVYAKCHEENPNSEDAVCAVLTNGEYTTNSIPAVEVAKYVPSIWRKRVIEDAQPNPQPKRKEPNFTYEESSLTYAWFPPLVLEEKPRRLSGNLSRDEMKRVLVSEEGLREISAHVAKMLHVYSIQEQGGEQETHWGKWSKKSKWSKREMDDMVMSFVVGRPRGTDANGNQQQPSGLCALIERIDLDGRRRNVTPTFREMEPWRYEGNGGKDGFIRTAAKWIAETCKERELWKTYRDVEMSPADQNAVSTDAAPETDLNRLYMSKRDEETAAMDRYFAELNTAWFSDDEPVGVPTDEESVRILQGNPYDYAVNHGPDMRPTRTEREPDWVYSRSGEPLPFNRMVDRYIGPSLVNVPWWEW